MPPKAKFTEEQIVAAALRIVRREGMARLTARSLGKELQSSVCPIFTVLESMEEVQCRVIAAAKESYAGYVRRGLQQELAFKGVGEQYIQFAIEEPELFRLLFMSEQNTGIDSFLPTVDDNYELILASVREPYALGDEEAKKLYLHLCVYAHGIATLCAMRVCLFGQEDISRMLTEVFVGLLKEMKRGKEQ